MISIDEVDHRTYSMPNHVSQKDSCALVPGPVISLLSLKSCDFRVDARPIEISLSSVDLLPANLPLFLLPGSYHCNHNPELGNTLTTPDNHLPHHGCHSRSRCQHEVLVAGDQARRIQAQLPCSSDRGWNKQREQCVSSPDILKLLHLLTLP